ncbi:Hypothetical predicted protein [Marmota monax]|uniref:Fibronectin type-III domain-containing protein n=1 Tax=Marmota monax TaxID=9995 RepID=A0A5E4AHT9_MARMO|nr:Hypothetical predicted protein [Marmota monax]
MDTLENKDSEAWERLGMELGAGRSRVNQTPPLEPGCVPVPPANLNLGFAAQPPALRASWSPPPGGRDGFRLRLYSLGPLALKSEETLAPEAQNFSWAQLSPGSKFLVQVATLHGPEESSSSNATAWTPPLAPLLVNVTSEGPTKLQASWVHASGNWDSYQVTVCQGGTRVATGFVGAEVNSTSLSSLTPGTKYEVEIASRAGPLRTAAANVSGWTSPLMPSELLVSMQAGSAVVNLAWVSSPLGQGTCHAQLSEAGHLSWKEPLELGQAHLMLRGLTPGRNLSLSVLCQAGPLQASTHPVVLPVAPPRCHPLGGHGHPHNAEPLVPTEPGPVEDVRCQTEAAHLVLNWTVPAGDVDACLVVAEQLAAGGSAHLVFQANTSEDALLLPCLEPATSYRLSLTTLGRNGLWSRTVTLVCATSAEGPLTPQSLEVISKNSPSDLTIGWALAPGQRDGYKVTWHQEGSQRSLGNLDLGPDNSSVTLKGLVPGFCYAVSVWAWAGNVSSSVQRIHSCTREFQLSLWVAARGLVSFAPGPSVCHIIDLEGH